MGKQRLSDKLVRELPAPASGNRVYRDAPNAKGNDYVVGFGLRVTAAGVRSFVLNYRTADGRERRHTIGRYPVWTLLAAREEAKLLKRDVDTGGDPLGHKQEQRGAPTVADLMERFTAEHLPTLRPSTREGYLCHIKQITAEIGTLKVATCAYADVDRLHRKITQRAPFEANRVLGVLSKAFNLAGLWEMREAANPCKQVKRNTEHARERYLTGEEMQRLTAALDGYSNQSAANVFRLLAWTGARLGETVRATWAQIDLDANRWNKPHANTKQKRDHSVPLSAPARQLLLNIRKLQPEGETRIFPGVRRLQYAWETIRAQVDLRTVRIHDLRHNYASVLINSGHDLPVVGRLLGHSSIAITQRYSHLYEDTLARAVDTAGAILTGKKKAPVVPLRSGQSRR
jgi:integrase